MHIPESSLTNLGMNKQNMNMLFQLLIKDMTGIKLKKMFILQYNIADLLQQNLQF